jgi:hypothetical protein
MNLSGKILGDASDIPALRPDKVAAVRIFASLRDFCRAYGHTRLSGYGGLASADGLALTAWCNSRGCDVVCAPRSVPLGEVSRLVGLASVPAGPEVCFLGYLTWLEGGVKNPVIAVLNRAINDTAGASVTAYIMDPDGQPSVVVGCPGRDRSAVLGRRQLLVLAGAAAIAGLVGSSGALAAAR